MSNLLDGKYSKAEFHFKECIQILKHSYSTETLGYNYVLKKYIWLLIRLSESLFKNKKYSECEIALKANIKLADNLKSYDELKFSSHRNLIAFYTYTNIETAISYSELLLNDQAISNNIKRFLIYNLGVNLYIS